MQYRFSEIKDGGYVTEHIQLPIVIDYPDEYLDEITMDMGNTWEMTKW